MKPATLEEIARLDEMPARRRAADLRNVAWFRVLLIFFSVTNALILTSVLHAGETPYVFIAIVFLTGTVAAFLIFRRIPESQSGPSRFAVIGNLAQRAERYVRAVILVTVFLEYLWLHVAAGDESLAWTIVLPLLMLPFRFNPSEFLLFHGGLASSIFFRELFFGSLTADRAWPLVIAAVVFNLIAVIGEALLSRGFNRRVVGEWRTARGRYQESVRMRQELEFAREIQLSMLPSEAPRIGWLDIASVSLPATEVGGDYYDFFEVDADRVAVVIGDVAGHGLASGIVLSGVRSCLTLLKDELREPGLVLGKLHRMIRETSRHRMLVSLAIYLLDREAGEITVTSAGHPPGLYIPGNGDPPKELSLASPPLGTGLVSEYGEQKTPWMPGDALVLQTDGVYEAMNEKGESYGFNRAARLAAEENTRGSKAIRDAVIRSLWEFRGEAVQDDDVTLIVIRNRSDEQQSEDHDGIAAVTHPLIAPS